MVNIFSISVLHRIFIVHCLFFELCYVCFYLLAFIFREEPDKIIEASLRLLGCYIFGRLLIFKLPGRFFGWKSVKRQTRKIFFIFNILKFHPSIEILGVLARPQQSKNRCNSILIDASVKTLVSKFSETLYSYLPSEGI